MRKLALNVTEMSQKCPKSQKLLYYGTFFSIVPL